MDTPEVDSYEESEAVKLAHPEWWNSPVGREVLDEPKEPEVPDGTYFSTIGEVGRAAAATMDARLAPGEPKEPEAAENAESLGDFVASGGTVMARREFGGSRVDMGAVERIADPDAWTADTLLAHHDKLSQASRALMALKNHDYAGHLGLSPFANFQTSEALGVVSTEQGIMVRLLDKIKRLCTFLEAGEFKVKDEKLDDTVQDAINYLVILSGYLAEKAARG